MPIPVFENKMKVRDYECDAQGVVNNANYLHYFEHARHEFMEMCGIRFCNLTAEKILPVVRSANIKYKNSLRGSNEFISSLRLQRKGLRYLFRQQIRRIPDNTVCAEALIEIVCTINGKIAAPETFDKAFAGYIEWID